MTIKTSKKCYRAEQIDISQLQITPEPGFFERAISSKMGKDGTVALNLRAGDWVWGGVCYLGKYIACVQTSNGIQALPVPPYTESGVVLWGDADGRLWGWIGWSSEKYGNQEQHQSGAVWEKCGSGYSFKLLTGIPYCSGMDNSVLGTSGRTPVRWNKINGEYEAVTVQKAFPDEWRNISIHGETKEGLVLTRTVISEYREHLSELIYQKHNGECFSAPSINNVRGPRGHQWKVYGVGLTDKGAVLASNTLQFDGSFAVTWRVAAENSPFEPLPWHSLGFPFPFGAPSVQATFISQDGRVFGGHQKCPSTGNRAVIWIERQVFLVDDIVANRRKEVRFTTINGGSTSGELLAEGIGPNNEISLFRLFPIS